MSAIKRNAAISCTLEAMAKRGPLFFWTLTIADEGGVHDAQEISRRWNHFLTNLRREYKGAKKVEGIRVYEMHPGGHGWHVHFVVTAFLDVRQVRRIAKQTGWGHIDVQPPSKKLGPQTMASYLCKYLTKERRAECKDVRLYSTFGLRGIATRQSDIETESAFKSIWKGVAAALIGFASLPWGAKLEAVSYAHHAWVCDEIADPSKWCADRLGTSSTSQRYCLDAERALSRVACRRWDNEIKWADIRAERAKNFAVWNDRLAKIQRMRAAEWQT